MTATAHALVGGAIAASIPDPVLGITLAVASHPFLDMIPHWDFGRGWRDKSKTHFLAEGIFDMSLGLVVSYLIFGRGVNPIYFFGAVFAALFFDLMMTPYWFLNWKFPPFSWAYSFGSMSNINARLPWGILNQAIAVLGIVLVLRVLH